MRTGLGKSRNCCSNATSVQTDGLTGKETEGPQLGTKKTSGRLSGEEEGSRLIRGRKVSRARSRITIFKAVNEGAVAKMPGGRTRERGMIELL